MKIRMNVKVTTPQENGNESISLTRTIDTEEVTDVKAKFLATFKEFAAKIKEAGVPLDIKYEDLNEYF